ncbi:MAG: winged helix-turn-helix domain-containing protein [Alphaproteobacteria bacterium]|nr:winged helix-turn-helix domain-containing protein [Alphaproteobacteria bacterium]
MKLVELGAARLDVTRGELFLRDASSVHLTPVETDLVAHLARCGGRPVGRDELLREVWHYSASARSRTVDVTLSRLRSKLQGTGVEVVTRRGEGIVLEVARGTPAAPAVVQPVVEVPIGRTEDLAALEHAACPGAVVRLTGLPGVGKSELGRAWCGRASGERIDLLGATDAATLRRALAVALGVASHDPEAGIRERLASSRPVLLDDADTLQPDAVTALEGWLRGATAPVVLTARTGPTLEGAVEIPIGVLPEPHAREVVRRARTAQSLPPLQPEQEDVLLAQFGGLPLALTVAAPVMDWLEAPHEAIDLPAGDGRTLADALEQALGRLDDDALACAHVLAAFRSTPSPGQVAEVLGRPAEAGLAALLRAGVTRPGDGGRVELLPAFRSVLRHRPARRSRQGEADGRLVDWLLHVPQQLPTLFPLRADVEAALAYCRDEQRLALLGRHIDLLTAVGPIQDVLVESERWTRDLGWEWFADGAVERLRAQFHFAMKCDLDALLAAAPEVKDPGRRAYALTLAALGLSWEAPDRGLEAIEAARRALADPMTIYTRVECMSFIGFALMRCGDSGAGEAILAEALELADPDLPELMATIVLGGYQRPPPDAATLARGRALVGELRRWMGAHEWAMAQTLLATSYFDAGQPDVGWDLVLDVLPVQEAQPIRRVGNALTDLAFRLVFDPPRLRRLMETVQRWNSPHLFELMTAFLEEREPVGVPDAFMEVWERALSGGELPRGAGVLRLSTGLAAAVRNRSRQAVHLEGAGLPTQLDGPEGA